MELRPGLLGRVAETEPALLFERIFIERDKTEVAEIEAEEIFRCHASDGLVLRNGTPTRWGKSAVGTAPALTK